MQSVRLGRKKKIQSGSVVLEVIPSETKGAGPILTPSPWGSLDFLYRKETLEPHGKGGTPVWVGEGIRVLDSPRERSEFLADWGLGLTGTVG